MKKIVCTIIVLALSICSVRQQVFALSAPETERIEASGLILPLDENSIYLRTRTGQVKVRWHEKTRVAIQLNYRNLENVADNKINFTIHSSSERISIPLPHTKPYAFKPFDRQADVDGALAENWVSCRDMSITFVNETLVLIDEEALIRAASGQSRGGYIIIPGLGGRFTFARGRGRPATIDVNGQKVEASMKKGGQTDVLIYGVWGIENCKPFINDATVFGKFKGDAILADSIHLRPIGDQAAQDNPELPRYLFIGDSISGNYDRGLRQALKGKFNIHHPPTNCGPSGKGAGRIDVWLGGYEVKGRGWDVISFNFGHWDAGNSREVYQKNLVEVIGKLKKTGARLIWVTTCPVPKGYPPTGGLSSESKAPSRTSGVMEKYLNRWAMEVIERHPGIAVCDQWQFVKDHEDDIYTEWWAGKNVHFGGDSADALGAFLAKKVLEVARTNKPRP